MSEDDSDANSSVGESEGEISDPKSKTDLVKIEHLKIIRTIGTGKFSRVLLCKHQNNGHYHALKLMVLEDIIRCKQVTHVESEKKILSSVSHPFIISLESSSLDTRFLYFVLPFIPGGELFSHLRAVGRFSIPVAQFFTAEVVSALSYLHSLHIVYRDLKPENILLDSKGHIKIVDFGLSKYVKHKTKSICGTPEYVAPEILLNAVTGYGRSVDWWSLGVLVHELVTGVTPWRHPDIYTLYDKIIDQEFTWHTGDESEGEDGVTETTRDFVTKLLVQDVAKRLGSGPAGSCEVKNHPWLKCLNWDEVDSGCLRPPIIPDLRCPGDSDQYPEYGEDMWWDVHELPPADRDRFIGF